MRVVDAVLRPDKFDALREAAEAQGHRVVTLAENDQFTVARITCQGGDTDEFLTSIREQLRDNPDGKEHYAVFEPVALEPRAEEDDDKNGEAVAGTDEIESFVDEGARFTRTFAVLSMLAGILAAVALLKDSTAVLIGSMVLAPLGKPIAMIGVATVLGRPRKAALAIAWLGFALAVAALAASVLTLLTLTHEITELIEHRTGTSFFDIVVALAAGLAMAYVIIKRDTTAMVGIVVAASLMPVAAALGIVVAAGRFDLIGGAVFTLASNVCGIVLGLVLGLHLESLRTGDRKDRLLASQLTVRSLAAGAVVMLGLASISAWSAWRSSHTDDLPTRIRDAMSPTPVLGLLRAQDGALVVLVEQGQRDAAEASVRSQPNRFPERLVVMEASAPTHDETNRE